jgi:hypothetical protein
MEVVNFPGQGGDGYGLYSLKISFFNQGGLRWFPLYAHDIWLLASTESYTSVRKFLTSQLKLRYKY